MQIISLVGKKNKKNISKCCLLKFLPSMEVWVPYLKSVNFLFPFRIMLVSKHEGCHIWTAPFMDVHGLPCRHVNLAGSGCQEWWIHRIWPGDISSSIWCAKVIVLHSRVCDEQHYNISSFPGPPKWRSSRGMVYLQKYGLLTILDWINTPILYIGRVHFQF